MTKQQIFNRAARHLLTQNKRCVDNEGNCQYRYSGLKCAAGVLIPDHKYCKEMEGASWTFANAKPSLKKIVQQVGHKRFVVELQLVHDRNTPDKWAGILVCVGEHHNLDTTVVEKYRQR